MNTKNQNQDTFKLFYLSPKGGKMFLNPVKELPQDVQENFREGGYHSYLLVREKTADHEGLILPLRWGTVQDWGLNWDIMKLTAEDFYVGDEQCRLPSKNEPWLTPEERYFIGKYLLALKADGWRVEIVDCDGDLHGFFFHIETNGVYAYAQFLAEDSSDISLKGNFYSVSCLVLAY